jgi:hypothetical protein
MVTTPGSTRPRTAQLKELLLGEPLVHAKPPWRRIREREERHR